MASPSKTSPLRVVLYCRVSSAEQKNRQTIESQPPELDRLVAGLDSPVEVVLAPDGEKYWKDDGKSGTTLRGRKLGTLLTQVDAGALTVDAIITVRTDRLYRPNPKSLKSIDDCHRIDRVILEHGIRVITLEGEDDPDQPLMKAVKVGMASQENATKSKRVNEGRTTRLMGGKPIWRLPYGYLRTGNLVDPVAIDEVRADHFRMLVAWTVEGGVAHASRRANEHGLPLPSDPLPPAHGPLRQWDQAHLWRLMKSAEQYLGTLRYTYRGTSGEVSVPAILDHETYLQLTRAMASKARTRGKRVHTVSGLLSCHGCGHTVQIHARPNGRAYLQCHTCGGTTRYDGEVEAWLWTAAGTWAMALAGAEVAKAQGNGLETALKKARAALKALQSKEEVLVGLHLDGAVSRAIYDRKRAPVQAEMRTQEAKIAELRKRIDERDTRSADEAGVIERAYATLGKMKATKDPRERNRLLRDLLGSDRVLFFKEGDRIRATFPKRGTVDPWTVNFGEKPRFVITIPAEPVYQVDGDMPVLQDTDTIKLYREVTPRMETTNHEGVDHDPSSEETGYGRK